MKNSRSLIYVPVIHTQADMGSMSGALKQEYIKKFGEQKWNQHVREIDQMWDGLRTKIDKLRLDWSKVRIYQDGLPVCGKEKEIVADLASKGSKNHEVVQWLVDNGANLEGTEDASLLLEEYNHIKKIANAKNNKEKDESIKEYEKIAQDLLSKRDNFIKERIDHTLKAGETGILFMGLLHRVDEGLNAGIKVSFLIHRLPFKRQAAVA